LKRRWILAFAAVVLGRAVAFASDAEPPKVELPLGPYVRPGRPLDVRVVGGAERVRAPGTPWALPQGERGDEFILQLTDATVGVLQLEVQRGGAIERVAQPVETLPADATIVGVRGDGAASPGTRPLRLSALGLPTVAEGWLLLDDIADGAAPPGATDLLRTLRELPPAARPFRVPLLFGTDEGAFVCAAKVAASAPRLPADVALVLELLAAAELVVLAILRFREASSVRHAAWLGVPAVVALAFLATPGRLPGALSATAVAVDAPGRVVLVYVEARRDGAARFVLPAGTTGAAMIRYSAADATVADASAGREVVLDLRAGESRLFAYAVERSFEALETSLPILGYSTTDARSPPPPKPLRNWLEGRGFERVRSTCMRFSGASLPRAADTVVIPAGSAWVLPPSK
jgi:hypothetical protein